MTTAVAYPSATDIAVAPLGTVDSPVAAEPSPTNSPGENAAASLGPMDGPSFRYPWPTPPVARVWSGPAERVRVSGLARQDPTGTVLMCGPATSTMMLDPAHPERECLNGVPTTGLDLDALAEPGQVNGYRWGSAAIEAWWDGTSFVVTAQGPPDPYLIPHGPPPVPCPAPAGGWPIDDQMFGLDPDAVRDAVGPGYADLGAGYPSGQPVFDDANPSGTIVPVVLVVRTTGDVAAADAAIRAVYSGNLCVGSAPWDMATVEAQRARIDRWVMEEADTSVPTWATGQNESGYPVNTMTVGEVTPGLRALIDELGEPAPEIDAWIRPLP